MEEQPLQEGRRSALIPQENLPKPLQKFKDWSALSSQVKSTKYEVDVEITNIESGEKKIENQMIVTFSNGGKYIYHNIPVDVWKLSLITSSIGKFINSSIKGKYDYKKLD